MTALHTYFYIVVNTQRGCHTLKFQLQSAWIFCMHFRVLVQWPDEDPHSGQKLAAQLYVIVKQILVCVCEF